MPVKPLRSAALRTLPSSCPLLRALALTLALVSGCVGAQTAGGTEPAPRFDILEFLVEGDTVLGAAAIERAVYPFLGPQRSLADAEGARKALESAYQAAGYLSVTVLLPPQTVGSGGGELRLQVMQAAVDRLRVTGAQYTLPSTVREALPSLAPGSVPNFNDMQQELASLAARSADRELTPLLAAGTRPNTLDVELKLQETAPLHGHAELNSKRSLGTVEGRLEAGVRWDNLFQRGHSVGLDRIYSPRRPAQSNIQSLLYNLPLGGEGDRLFLNLTHSNSDTPTALGGATVSRGDTLRLRWRDELRSIGGAGGARHALSWGLAWRDLRDANREMAGFSMPASSLRYPSFSIGYDIDLSGQAGRSTRLAAEFTASLRGLAARQIDCGTGALAELRDQFDCKRSGARPGFQLLTLDLSHTEPLGAWRLLARLQGQLTDAPLVPAEQAVYGGEASVRGYFEGEVAGDLGAALRLELQAPAWAPRDGLQLQALAFHDLAQTHRLDALPGETANTRLHSVGLGLQLDSRFGLSAGLTWAQVLRATRTARQDGTPRGGRLDFTLRQRF